MRIKKGDTVKVLSGNDKGKTGEILALAVAPNYDPNEFSKYTMQEMKNWVIVLEKHR